MEDHVGDLGEFLHSLPRPAILVGHSLGGCIAQVRLGSRPQAIIACLHVVLRESCLPARCPQAVTACWLLMGCHSQVRGACPRGAVLELLRGTGTQLLCFADRQISGPTDRQTGRQTWPRRHCIQSSIAVAPPILLTRWHLRRTFSRPSSFRCHAPVACPCYTHVCACSWFEPGGLPSWLLSDLAPAAAL